MKEFKSKLMEMSTIYEIEKGIPNVKITQSSVVNDYIRKVYPVDINEREAFLALYLNQSNRTLGVSIISIGGLTSTIVDVRLILRDALLTQSTSIVLVHNHPSGCYEPSQADVVVTDKVKAAAKVMDIALLDHLIITEWSFFSFADEGKL